MSSPYLANANTWAYVLRNLMGWRVSDTPSVSFCTSSARDTQQAMELIELARDMRRDLVHLSFDDEGTNEPRAVSLVVRQRGKWMWLPNARLYTADEGAPFELLVAGRRWYMVEGLLKAGKLPPAHRRDRGDEAAKRRWREAWASMAPVESSGSVWVPPGGRFADAIPHEQLRVAA